MDLEPVWSSCGRGKSPSKLKRDVQCTREQRTCKRKKVRESTHAVDQRYAALHAQTGLDTAGVQPGRLKRQLHPVKRHTGCLAASVDKRAKSTSGRRVTDVEFMVSCRRRPHRAPAAEPSFPELMQSVLDAFATILPIEVFVRREGSAPTSKAAYQHCSAEAALYYRGSFYLFAIDRATFQLICVNTCIADMRHLMRLARPQLTAMAVAETAGVKVAHVARLQAYHARLAQHVDVQLAARIANVHATVCDPDGRVRRLGDGQYKYAKTPGRKRKCGLTAQGLLDRAAATTADLQVIRDCGLLVDDVVTLEPRCTTAPLAVPKGNYKGSMTTAVNFYRCHADMLVSDNTLKFEKFPFTITEDEHCRRRCQDFVDVSDPDGFLALLQRDTPRAGVPEVAHIPLSLATKTSRRAYNLETVVKGSSPMAFQCTPLAKGHVCLCASALQVLTSALVADPQLSYGAACDRLCNAIPSLYHTAPEVADLLTHFEPKIEYMKANPNHYFYPLGDMHVQPGDPLYRAGYLDLLPRSILGSTVPPVPPTMSMAPTVTPVTPVLPVPPTTPMVSPVAPVTPVVPAAPVAPVVATSRASVESAVAAAMAAVMVPSMETPVVPTGPASGVDPNEGLRAAAWAFVKAVQRLQPRP